MKPSWTWIAVVIAAAVVWSCSDGAKPGDAGAEAAAEDTGYPPTGDDGSEGCVLDGYPCTDGAGCCSGVCSGGTCGSAGACTPVGAACDTPDTCCSRVCTDAGCADGG